MFERVATFTDKYPLIGPTFWFLSLQYFMVQVIVAAAWSTTYSWRHNTISDLGNTACAQYGSRYVCSPLNAVMNSSFIVLGATMIAGSLLIYQEFKEKPYVKVGFSFMGLAGLGTIFVGLFPENTTPGLHIVGAGLPFLIGNLGLMVLGFGLDIPKIYKLYTIFSGLLALVALGLLVSGRYLGLDIGGMERLTSYPQTIWLITFGIYMSRNHFSKANKTN